MELNLKLTVEETQAILNVLGDLPSKTGAWPLIVKIKEQAQAQLPKKDQEVANDVASDAS